MPQGRKVWIGGIGVGVDLIFVAAAALGAPRPIWILALFIGTAMIIYAFVFGEPDSSERPSEAVQTVKGGRGDGDVRGNVFGDNATITVGQQTPVHNPPVRKGLVQVSPAELLEIYNDHTEIQAKKLVEPYIGGWMELEGNVNDVSLPGDSKSHRVSLDIGDALAFLTFPTTPKNICRGCDVGTAFT